MQLQEIKEYLLPLGIPDIDKRYTMNFCKKLEYLEGLRSKVAKDTGMNVSGGYGDINSNICFIFNNVKNFNVMKSIIQEKLDLFDINFWQIYVTFINKIEKDYSMKYSMITSELSAVKPKLLYVFDKDKRVYDEIINSLNKFNVAVPERNFFVDVMDLASDDEEIKKQLWFTLHYLINYKTQDINK